MPSTEKAIRYLHAVVGLPPKAMRLKASQAGNFDTWPMILNIRNVNKCFPESDEMQKGHVRQTKQGIQSTKLKEMMDEYFPMTAIPKEQDIMVTTFEMWELIPTDQMGRCPVTLSRGNKYIMVMCEIDGSANLG